MRPYLENIYYKKKKKKQGGVADRVAQGEDPEFKPHYHKNKLINNQFKECFCNQNRKVLLLSAN
jgi:hypothetical protein